MAQSGHSTNEFQCLLLGVKRTLIRRSEAASFVSSAQVQYSARVVGSAPRSRILLRERHVWAFATIRRSLALGGFLRNRPQTDVFQPEKLVLLPRATMG